MILGRYFHVAGLYSPDRMIRTVVAKGKFEGFPAQCQTQYLMPRQIPNTGFLPISLCTFSIAYVTVCGSPGPLDRKIPSGSEARTSSAVAVAGNTSHSWPRVYEKP